MQALYFIFCRKPVANHIEVFAILFLNWFYLHSDFERYQLEEKLGYNWVISQFWKHSACYEKYLKENKHNSLHLNLHEYLSLDMICSTEPNNPQVSCIFSVFTRAEDKIFHGIPRESLHIYFISCHRKVQWPTQSMRHIRWDGWM